MQKRILIVRTDRVGDVVMITPMVHELKKTFPNAFIAAMVRPETKDILVNNPHLDLIITDSLAKENFRHVVKQLRGLKLTDGLLVFPTQRAAYQMFFAGIKNRIGVGRKLYEVITFMKSVSRNNYIPLRHEADYCMDLARKIGVKTDNIKPEIFITTEEKNYGLEILKSHGVSESNYKIIIHTGSGNSAENWDEKKYLALIEAVLNKHKNAKIILTAKEMSESFIKQAEKLNNGRIANVTGDTSKLRDLISVIANSNILIASSTGPLHIAAALDIKTVGLFCHRSASSAARWGALSDKAFNIEVTKEYCDSNCSPDKTICRLAGGISVEEVLKEI